MQSDTPAPGTADGMQEMQIDGREAPTIDSGSEVSGEDAKEPEPEGMDIDDEPDENAVPVVTPVLMVEQIMDMCIGAGRQDLTAVELCRSNLRRACPYLPSEGLPDNDALLRIFAEE